MQHKMPRHALTRRSLESSGRLRDVDRKLLVNKDAKITVPDKEIIIAASFHHIASGQMNLKLKPLMLDKNSAMLMTYIT